SLALDLFDSLEQQLSSLFVPISNGIDFELKLSLGFTNGFFIFSFKPLDFSLVRSNLPLDLNIDKLAAATAEHHATEPFHASIERRNPYFIHLRHNRPFIRDEIHIDFSQEVVADS